MAGNCADCLAQVTQTRHCSQAAVRSCRPALERSRQRHTTVATVRSVLLRRWHQLVFEGLAHALLLHTQRVLSAREETGNAWDGRGTCARASGRATRLSPPCLKPGALIRSLR